MKNRKFSYLLLAIVFVVFNIIANIIPVGRTPSFWVTFVFTDIAFLIQPLIWYISLKEAETLKAKFLGIPILYLGTEYLFFQLIAFSVICAFHVKIWLSIIIDIVLFSFMLIGIFAANCGKKIIADTDARVGEKVTYIKALQVEIELIADAEKDPEIKNELRKLTEAIRYSDPMGDDSLADIEKTISDRVSELKSAGDKTQLISVISNLIAERNKRCKLLK